MIEFDYTVASDEYDLCNYVHESEQNSIYYFMQRLEDKGWKNVHNLNEDNPFSSYDIYAEYNDMKVVFELKRRTFDSKKYGDMVMEEYKYNKGLKEYPDCKYALVSFFTDCIGLSFINEFTTQDVSAPHTTDFQDNRYINKTFISIKNFSKFTY